MVTEFPSVFIRNDSVAGQVAEGLPLVVGVVLVVPVYEVRPFVLVVKPVIM